MLKCLIALCAVAIGAAARQQTVGVRGQLMCGDRPLSATVKLWDLNTFPNPDEMLSQITTDSDGRFQIFGTVNDWTTEDPAVRFYHRCNNKGLIFENVCQREVTLKIPKTYINSGTTVGRWYEVGTMNLEAKQPHEQSHCFSFPGRK